MLRRNLCQLLSCCPACPEQQPSRSPAIQARRRAMRGDTRNQSPPLTDFPKQASTSNDLVCISLISWFDFHCQQSPRATLLCCMVRQKETEVPHREGGAKDTSWIVSTEMSRISQRDMALLIQAVAAYKAVSRSRGSPKAKCSAARIGMLRLRPGIMLFLCPSVG